jgi:DNA-binding transcriptional MocR family regulator
MTTLRADLPVVVDRYGRVPMATQISVQVREAVTAGVLRAGDRLPSTRDLAATLAVSRTVVTTTLDSYFDGPPAMNGLILGYGTASLPKIRRAARVLHALLARIP